MAILTSQINKNSTEFKNNAAVMNALVDELLTQINAITLGGDEKSRQRHRNHGKLLPRERLQHLLDPGSSFLELSTLAAYQVYDDVIPAAGIITGIGSIAKTQCMIIANDATVKGGTYYPLTIKNI
jgi:3-methylcrotonyl-CoA carboxylase beta subunit